MDLLDRAGCCPHPQALVGASPQERSCCPGARANGATLKGMDLSSADRLLRSQDGVISRAQAFECGLDDNALERLLRRRELARLHPGVYVDHTGMPTWSQRAWGAVLFHSPAALAGPSALRAHGLRSVVDERGWRPSGGDAARPLLLEPIHVVVDASRRVVPPPGVVVTRRTDFDGRVQLHLSPPRVRLDEALLDVASVPGRGRCRRSAGRCLPRRKDDGRSPACNAVCARSTGSARPAAGHPR